MFISVLVLEEKLMLRMFGVAVVALSCCPCISPVHTHTHTHTHTHRALEDACNAISLKADWPKGYYRKGRALAGLKVG